MKKNCFFKPVWDNKTDSDMIRQNIMIHLQYKSKTYFDNYNGPERFWRFFFIWFLSKFLFGFCPLFMQTPGNGSMT